MSYLKIDDVDFSRYVNKLTINNSATYSAQTNAAGDTVVDYINTKKTIEAGIIPLDAATMAQLQAAINKLQVTVTYREPLTNELNTINCILPSNGVDYYTIQANKVMFNAFNLKFVEL